MIIESLKYTCFCFVLVLMLSTLFGMCLNGNGNLHQSNFIRAVDSEFEWIFAVNGAIALILKVGLRTQNVLFCLLDFMNCYFYLGLLKVEISLFALVCPGICHMLPLLFGLFSSASCQIDSDVYSYCLSVIGNPTKQTPVRLACLMLLT